MAVYPALLYISFNHFNLILAEVKKAAAAFIHSLQADERNIYRPTDILLVSTSLAQLRTLSHLRLHVANLGQTQLGRYPFVPSALVSFPSLPCGLGVFYPRSTLSLRTDNLCSSLAFLARS